MSVISMLDTTNGLDRFLPSPRRTHGDTAPGAAPVSFAAHLDEYTSRRAAGSTPPRNDRHAQARDVANQLVATTFILPILSQLRETAAAAGPFAPGTAEKRFGPMLDQHIADRLMEAAQFDIVDAIADRYVQQAQPNATADQPAPQSAQVMGRHIERIA